jgi:hypothetical protein
MASSPEDAKRLLVKEGLDLHWDGVKLDGQLPEVCNGRAAFYRYGGG